jgi:hypothetical protein
MKKLLLLLLLLTVMPLAQSYAQFDKFSFQITAGIAEPMGDLKGNTPFMYNQKWTGYWLNYNTNPPVVDSTQLYNILMTDSNFIKDNYGAKTGFSFSGSAKINFDKFNTFRGVATLSVASFNTFESDKSGNTPLLLYNQGYTYQPVNYSYTFTAVGLGLGLEIAPTAFTNVFTPYFGGSFNFNFLSAELTRSYGRDSSKASFGGEFRLGVSLYGGLEVKVSKGIDIVAGAKYDFANLLLKTTRSSISDAIEYGKTNLSLNDGEGFYYANLSDPIAGSSGYKTYNTKSKAINYMTFFIGVNIYPGMMKGF